MFDFDSCQSNLIILIRMGNITDRLVSRYERFIVTVDICLHKVWLRVGLRYVITKFSRMDSLPNFVIHGAPLHALRARESSAINNFLNFKAASMKAFCL